MKYKIFCLLLVGRIYTLDWSLTPTDKILNYIDRENVTLVCFEDDDNNIEDDVVEEQT